MNIKNNQYYYNERKKALYLVIRVYEDINSCFCMAIEESGCGVDNCDLNILNDFEEIEKERAREIMKSMIIENFEFWEV